MCWHPLECKSSQSVFDLSKEDNKKKNQKFKKDLSNPMFSNSSKLEACRCTKCNNFQYEGVPGNMRLIWLTVWFSFKTCLVFACEAKENLPTELSSNLLFQFKLNLKSRNVILQVQCFLYCTLRTFGSAPKLILPTVWERRRILCPSTSPSSISVTPVEMYSNNKL